MNEQSDVSGKASEWPGGNLADVSTDPLTHLPTDPRTSAPAPAPVRQLQAACWHQIGIYGDGSCPELTQFVHCRNCPVYSRAGLELLDRAPPPEYRREWTEHFAREKKLAAPRKRSVVVFCIGEEWLALPTPVFQEVAERRPIHSLPHRRHGVVLGLANIRGELLICVSLGRLLGLPTLEIGPQSGNLPLTHSPTLPPALGAQLALRAPHTLDRLLVIHLNGHRFAFPVNEVKGVHRFEPHYLQSPPTTVAQANPTFTQGLFRWQDRSVGLLEAEVLFAALNRNLA